MATRIIPIAASALATLLLYPAAALADGLTPEAVQGVDPAVVRRVAPNADPMQLPAGPDQLKGDGPVSLSLPQALALGLAYNRDLLVAREGLSGARSSYRKAQALLFPTISANAGASNGLASSDALGAAQLGHAATPSWAADPSLEVSYDVGLDGGRAAQLELGQAQVSQAELEVDRQRLALRQQIAGAYYDLQAADEQVRIAQRDYDYAVRSVKDTEALKAAGVQTVFEVQRAKVYEARTKAANVSAQARQLVARRSLARVLGLAYGADVRASDPVARLGAWSLTLPDTITRAIAARPEVAQARLQEQAGAAQMKLAESAIRPHLLVSAGADYLAVPGSAVGYNGGVRLSLPILDGGAADAGREAARADRRAAAIKLADAASQIQLQVEQAYADLEATRANIETTTVALKTAKESLESARIRFQAGVGTQTELIGAENDLSQADLDATNAVLGYNRAIAALQALAPQP
jgi:OMF family outer membrane factor